MPKNEMGNETIISVNQLKTIFKKEKKIILTTVIACFALGATFALTRPIEYIAEGTFKDKAKAGTASPSLAGLLGAGQNENNAIALMKSRSIKEDLVKKLDLQAELNTQESFTLLRTIWKNIVVDLYHAFYPHFISLNDRDKPFNINKINYDGEVPKTLKLQFITEDTFEIHDTDHPFIAKIDIPVVHENYHFTIKKSNENNIAGQTFNLTLWPLNQAAKKISDNMYIEQDRQDKNLINIKFKNPNRHLSAMGVNALMSSYKDYLQKEQNLIIHHQIQYLEKRQNEISKQLKNSMESHVLKISDDIKNIGFPNTTLAMEFLTESQNSLQKKLLDIEFELKRIYNSQKMEQVGQKPSYSYYDMYSLPGDPTIINQMQNEMRDLKQQSEWLQFSLKDHKNTEKEIVIDSSIHDFQGIDLKTTQSLFVSYTHKLNEIESHILQNQFIIDEIEKPDFDLTALNTVTNDPVSQEMSKQAIHLALNLKDSNNRSIKEQERIKEDLDLQKRFLSIHLKSSNRLLQLDDELMKYKVKTLQNVTLGLIQQKISLLENNLGEYMQSRVKNLKTESEIIEQHKISLMSQMSTLPSKWVSEKMIHLAMDLNQKMVEEVSKLVEKTNIENNLEMIQSTVIDHAVTPINPKPAKILFFGVLGALIGLFSSVAFAVNRNLKDLK